MDGKEISCNYDNAPLNLENEPYEMNGNTIFFRINNAFGTESIRRMVYIRKSRMVI